MLSSKYLNLYIWRCSLKYKDKICRESVFPESACIHWVFSLTRRYAKSCPQPMILLVSTCILSHSILIQMMVTFSSSPALKGKITPFWRYLNTHYRNFHKFFLFSSRWARPSSMACHSFIGSRFKRQIHSLWPQCTERLSGKNRHSNVPGKIPLNWKHAAFLAATDGRVKVTW